MKDNVKINVNGSEKPQEIVIREGAAEILKEPKIVEINGVIGAPLEWLKKRKGFGQVTPETCHVKFRYDEMKIILICDEKNHYHTTITGKTMLNPDLTKFGINGQKVFTVKELKSLLKMNRFLFADQDENFKVVSNLEKFRANIQTQIEDFGSNRGDKTKTLDVKVDSSLDLHFTLNMPIFTGEEKSRFTVEICFDIKDAAVEIWLESPELKQLIELGKVALIDKNIEEFKQGYAVIQY